MEVLGKKISDFGSTLEENESEIFQLNQIIITASGKQILQGTSESARNV